MARPHVSSPADWLSTRVSDLGREVYLHVGIRHRSFEQNIDEHAGAFETHLGYYFSVSGPQMVMTTSFEVRFGEGSADARLQACENPRATK
jgi:hypothetical protein